MVSLRSATSTLAVGAVFGSVACGNADAPGANSSGGSAGTLATAGSGGGSGAAGAGGLGGGSSCPKGPGYEPSGAPQWVSQLTGKIHDQTGGPAAKVTVMVCGFGACSKLGTTSDQGEVCTPDPTTGLCTAGMFPGLEITRPAFKYGLGIDYVKLAQPLPSTGTAHAVGEVTALRLPDVSAGAVLVPGTQATSNGVTLTLAAGTQLDFDVLVFDAPELQRFRAVELPVAKAPPAVDQSFGFQILVGTTPTDTALCPPAALSVPNTAGWAAGTPVELWVHGVSVLEEWAPYGGWGKVSDGKVSPDGSRVVTNDGEGVPILGLFGIRKK